MGCAVKKLDDGQEVDVHLFDTREKAENYLKVGRRYTYERHETWGLTSGIDFYRGATPGERASLREKTVLIQDGPRAGMNVPLWSVAFWVNKMTERK